MLFLGVASLELFSALYAYLCVLIVRFYIDVRK